MIAIAAAMERPAASVSATPCRGEMEDAEVTISLMYRPSAQSKQIGVTVR